MFFPPGCNQTLRLSCPLCCLSRQQYLQGGQALTAAEELERLRLPLFEHHVMQKPPTPCHPSLTKKAFSVAPCAMLSLAAAVLDFLGPNLPFL